MQKRVLRGRVNIQFCILNESSATREVLKPGDCQRQVRSRQQMMGNGRSATASTVGWQEGHGCKGNSTKRADPAQFSVLQADDFSRALDKIWLRWCAHRVKPATDVHLGVSFTAVMPGSGSAGGFRIPPVHGEVGISTSNHEPVGATGGNESTNFTPEFLQCCHLTYAQNLALSEVVC
jgi:hypothetical protein